MTLPEMNRVLDELLVNPREGDAGRYALITSFLGAMLIVPSGADMISGKESFQPVLVEESGQPFMVVYGSAEAARRTEEIAPFGMTMTGADLVRLVASNLGLMVITDRGRMGLDPAFLNLIRADLASGRA
jgi:hypothetical protein